MPFRIELAQSPGMPPLVLAPEYNYSWSPRAADAVLFSSMAEAEALIASLNLHDAEVRGVRNTVE